MPNIDFALTIEYIELHKLLKLTDVVDSGGAGKAVIADSVATVSGQPELRKTAKIRTGQVVMLGDVRVAVRGFD